MGRSLFPKSAPLPACGIPDHSTPALAFSAVCRTVCMPLLLVVCSSPADVAFYTTLSCTTQCNSAESALWENLPTVGALLHRLFLFLPLLTCLAGMVFDPALIAAKTLVPPMPSLLLYPIPAFRAYLGYFSDVPFGIVTLDSACIAAIFSR